MPNTVYRFYVEKLGNKAVSQFVGDKGEIFYDPNTGNLRLSDGVTPGGIPLLSGAGGTSDISRVSKAGDIMTGLLTLSGDPINPLQAATKQYVDYLFSLKANLDHIHDDRYYTETEIDTLLSVKTDIGHGHTVGEIFNLQPLLNAKADIAHSHNDIYYTETEVDALLNLKSPTVHTHALSSLSDVDSTTVAPTNNNILAWDGTKWVPAVVPGLQIIEPTPPAEAPWDSNDEILQFTGQKGILHANGDKSIIIFYPDDSSGLIKVSTDHGYTWTTSTQYGLGPSIVYTLNNKFYIRSMNSNGDDVYTSTDGLNWTVETMAMSFFTSTTPIPGNGYVIYHSWHPNFPDSVSDYISTDGINFTQMPNLPKGSYMSSYVVNGKLYMAFSIYNSSPFRFDTVIASVDNAVNKTVEIVATYIGFKIESFFYDQVLQKFVLHGHAQAQDGSYRAADAAAYFLTSAFTFDQSTLIPGITNSYYKFDRFVTGEIVATPTSGSILVSIDNWASWTAMDSTYEPASSQVITSDTIVLARNSFTINGFITSIYTSPLTGTNQSVTNTPLEFKLVDLLDTNITSPTTGQVLAWNGTKWVNSTSSGGGGVINKTALTWNEPNRTLSYTDTNGDSYAYLISAGDAFTYSYSGNTTRVITLDANAIYGEPFTFVVQSLTDNGDGTHTYYDAAGTGTQHVINTNLSVTALPTTGLYDGKIVEFQGGFYKWVAVPGTWIQIV